MKRIATLAGLIVVAVTIEWSNALAAESDSKQTWYLYGSALLSDQKTVVVTRLLNIDTAVAGPAGITARTARMEEKLRRELTEHITTKMHREVTSVTTVADPDRLEVRDKRDGEISARRASGTMRTIFLNGFEFSWRDQN